MISEKEFLSGQETYVYMQKCIQKRKFLWLSRGPGAYLDEEMKTS